MRTGVEIAVTGNAKSEAEQIARGFDAVTQSADGINSAFDTKLLENYNRQLTQIGETYSQIKNKEKSYNQQQLNVNRQLQSAVSGVGTGVAQLGAGNVGGAASSGLSGLSSLLGGPAAMIAGLGLAGGMATNALANQYEQRAVPAGRVASLSGQYGTDVRSNTLALRDAMESTTESVAKYGKTFEEGSRAQESFLMAGGRDFGGSQAAAYSQAYGADFGRLASFEGLMGRYGQSGGVQSADWVRQRQGLSPAMLGEVIGGIQDVFTQGISSGVVRSPSDIARSMDYFSGAGISFQGALGAQKLAGMNQTLAGAGGLQNQTDMFLYRAASGISGGDYLETRKLMEQGMTPEMFKGLMGEFEQFGYGKNESIMQLSKMFGMSITEAEKVFNNQGRGAGLGIGTGLEAGTGATVESQYTGKIETIKQDIAGGLGSKAFDARAALVGGVLDLFEGFGDSKAAETIHTKTLIASNLQIGESFATDAFGAEVYNPAKSLSGVRGGYSELINMIDEARSAGVTETSLYGGIRGAYKDVTARGSEGGGEITSKELATLEPLFRELIAAVREDVVVEDASYGKQITGFQQ